jgi:hypothetical protein
VAIDEHDVVAIGLLRPDESVFHDALHLCHNVVVNSVPVSAAEMKVLSLSEIHARIYWWCSPPNIGTANV